MDNTISTSELYRYISEWNNSGLMWIESDPALSAHYFHMALEAPITPQEEAHIDCGCGLVKERHTYFREIRVTSTIRQDSSDLDVGDQAYTQHGGSMSFECDVFVRPIQLMTATDAVYMNDPITNLGLAVGVVLFNLAIARHLQALQSTHDEITAQKLFKVAQDLYSKAERIFSSRGVSFSHSLGHTAVMDIIIMAIHLNKAQCALSLACNREAGSHLQELVAFSNTVTLRTPAMYDREAVNVLIFYISHFRTIATLFKPPTGAAAA